MVLLLGFFSLDTLPLQDIQAQLLIGSLQNLRHLRLSHCAFRGAIPRQLRNLSRLVFLDLSYTDFLEAESLILEYLDLCDNYLQGPIPDGFIAMDSLKHLDLSLNDLEGDIPRGLWNLYSLDHLYFYSNRLTGELPPSLTNCTRKEVIDPGENRLSVNSLPWLTMGAPYNTISHSRSLNMEILLASKEHSDLS
ncbi:LRR receptor serine/threonine-protein [Salix suchowensis]|nr:LRR receptor serine/threonine-protein [Salix suchowensis]